MSQKNFSLCGDNLLCVMCYVVLAYTFSLLIGDVLSVHIITPVRYLYSSAAVGIFSTLLGRSLLSVLQATTGYR
jgi:hypothetical protein